MKRKKGNEQYVHTLRTANLLIDPEDPSTQEKAYELFGELRDYPEEYHTQNLAMQEALRTMLRDGTIGGREDHDFIVELMREDRHLPLWPVWDPKGIIMMEAAEASGQDFLNSVQLYWKRGLFNPRTWKVDKTQVKGFEQKVKAVILRRLYRGAKRYTDEQLMELFQTKRSPFTGKEVDDNLEKFWRNNEGTGPEYVTE